MFDIKALPQEGVLKPNQLKPVQIIIQSLSIPTRMTIFITCKFVYLERVQAHATKIENTRKYGKVFDSCFSITEKSGYNPVVSIQFVLYHFRKWHIHQELFKILLSFKARLN